MVLSSVDNMSAIRRTIQKAHESRAENVGEELGPRAASMHYVDENKRTWEGQAIESTLHAHHSTDELQELLSLHTIRVHLS